MARLLRSFRSWLRTLGGMGGRTSRHGARSRANRCRPVVEQLETRLTPSVSLPDLAVGKANDVGSETTLGNSWTWTITMANIGDADANFSAGQTIFVDDLPDQFISYGTPSAGNFISVTGSDNIAVTLVGSDLTVTATGPVTLAGGGGGSGSFDVIILATPQSSGTFTNPRAGGTAAVDPGNVIVESDETNNLCDDTVIVTAPATHFVVTAPAATTAGAPFTVTVRALDQFDNLATGYTGTVHLTKSDSGAGSAVPANYTFNAADAGVHTFTNGVTLVTAGNQTVSATDAANSSITGKASVTVNAASATHLNVSAPAGATAGAPFSVTVTALDQFNNVATSYTGTVHFTKGDVGVGSSLPADYTFLPGDAGVHTFTNGVTFVTAGSQTVTATDSVDASITGTSGTITVSAAGHLRCHDEDDRQSDDHRHHHRHRQCLHHRHEQDDCREASRAAPSCTD